MFMIYKETTQTHTLLGAMHKYVNCHAACSKSYFHFVSLTREELCKGVTHHLLKTM